MFYPPLKCCRPGLEGGRAPTILPLDDALVAEARAFLQSDRSLKTDVRAQVANLAHAQRLSSRAERLCRMVSTRRL